MASSIPEALISAFGEIQQARSDHALENYVIGQRFTPEGQYAQCVLEAQIKWDAVRTARLKLEQKDLQIAAIRGADRRAEIRRELKAIEREQIERALLGAERELATLVQIFESFPQKYTHEQLQAAAPEESQRMLCAHAVEEYKAFGYVAPGTQEGLRQAGIMSSVQAVDGRTQLVFQDRPKQIEERTP